MSRRPSGGGFGRASCEDGPSPLDRRKRPRDDRAARSGHRYKKSIATKTEIPARRPRQTHPNQTRAQVPSAAPQPAPFPRAMRSSPSSPAAAPPAGRRPTRHQARRRARLRRQGRGQGRAESPVQGSRNGRRDRARPQGPRRAKARLPAMVVAEIVERDRDGELIARPVEWGGPGEAPRILVRRPRLRRESAPAPGIGARALMRVELDPEAGPRDPAYGGRVVKLLDARARARARRLSRARERRRPRAAGREARRGARDLHSPGPRATAPGGRARRARAAARRALRRAGGARRRTARLGRLRTRDQPDRARRPQHPACLPARRARRGRSGARPRRWPIAKTGAPCRW